MIEEGATWFGQVGDGCSSAIRRIRIRTLPKKDFIGLDIFA
jgi:hypothetical protein